MTVSNVRWSRARFLDVFIPFNGKLLAADEKSAVTEGR
jgi:hypothetical protein